MNHEIFDTLAAAYAVGALDGEDRARLEAHLADGCPECEAILRESGEAFVALARETPPAVPPPDVKAALMRRVATEPGTAQRPSPTRSRLRWLAASAAAVIAIAAFTGAFVAARYEARLGEMAREMAAIHEVTALLRDPATRLVTLHGLGPAPRGLAHVVWNDRTGGRIFMTNLKPAPHGKAYELWTIGEGAPRPAGLVPVHASGTGSRHVEPMPGGESVKVFAVTIEPAGGVPAPTGPMILASK
jgi:anti-sigma-K factor RskA